MQYAVLVLMYTYAYCISILKVCIYAAFVYYRWEKKTDDLISFHSYTKLSSQNAGKKSS